MNSKEIKILPDGKLEKRWWELYNDIVFELHDIKIISTFNFDDEDEEDDLKEYHQITGKLTQPFQRLYIKDDSKTVNNEIMVLKEFEIENTDVYISTASDILLNQIFKLQEFEDSRYFMGIIPKTRMKSLLRQIHSRDTTISLSVNFANSFYDSYAPEIYDVYLNDTKGKINRIEVVSKLIPKEIGSDTEEIKPNNTSDDVKKLSKEILQIVYDNDGRHQVEMKQMYVNQGVMVISTVVIVVAIVICNLYC